MKKKLLILLTVFSISGLAMTAAPGVPTNIDVEFVTPHQAKITWEDNTTNESGFQLTSASRNGFVATVKANSTETFFDVVPGQEDTMTLCALSGDGSWDKACAKPFILKVPRTVGTLSGQIVDQNFQPLTSRSFKFVAATWLQYEYADLGNQRMFIINDHLVNSNFVFNIAVVPLEQNCKAQLQNPVRQNDIFRETGKISQNDPSGVWFINLKGDGCRSNVILNIHSDCNGNYCEEISSSFKTDESGRFTVENLPISGTYNLKVEEQNIPCTFTATGDEKISITESTKNANFICRM